MAATSGQGDCKLPNSPSLRVCDGALWRAGHSVYDPRCCWPDICEVHCLTRCLEDTPWSLRAIIYLHGLPYRPPTHSPHPHPG